LLLFAYVHYVDYAAYADFFQVHIDLAITDHVGQDQQASFAATSDNIGAGFRYALRKGWPLQRMADHGMVSPGSTMQHTRYCKVLIDAKRRKKILYAVPDTSKPLKLVIFLKTWLADAVVLLC
jgi:hypothetical protein